MAGIAPAICPSLTFRPVPLLPPIPWSGIDLAFTDRSRLHRLSTTPISLKARRFQDIFAGLSKTSMYRALNQGPQDRLEVEKSSICVHVGRASTATSRVGDDKANRGDPSRQSWGEK